MNEEQRRFFMSKLDVLIVSLEFRLEDVFPDKKTVEIWNTLHMIHRIRRKYFTRLARIAKKKLI